MTTWTDRTSPNPPISQWKMNDDASNSTVTDSIGSNNGTFNDSSLKGHWKMNDDAANSDVIDSSGNANTGTFYSAGAIDNTSLHSVVGKINTALDFDGLDDYVEIPDDISLDISGDITISHWIYIENYDSWAGTVTKMSGSSAYSGYGFRLSGGDIQGTLYGNTNIVSANINNNEWVHVVMTYDSSIAAGSNDIFLYINGTQVDAGELTTTNYTNNIPLVIGALSYLTNLKFQGQIDDVRIYDRALSSDEISNLYNSGNGTEADDTNTILHSVTGKVNNALTFDGGDGCYISVPADTSFTNLNIGSISLWVNTNTTDLGFAFGYNVSSSNYFRLNVDGNSTIRFLCEVGNSIVTNIYSDDNITTGTWYYVVITQDGSNAQMYVNGVAQDHSGETNSGNWFNDEPSSPFYIGYKMAWSGYGFDGKIDDVRIYDYVLTQAEVLGIYNNGSGTETATWVDRTSLSTTWDDVQF